MLRLRLPRWLATAGAALVVLDAYAIALEQQVLAEAFFTLALVASFYLVVGRDRGTGVAGRGRAAARARRHDAHRRAVRGARCGSSMCCGRTARCGSSPRPRSALVVPLLAYSAWHSADTGRVRPHAGRRLVPVRAGGGDRRLRRRRHPARRARPLCARNARDRREGAAYHIWNADGPARRVFGGMSRDPQTQERSNRILRDFALAIIRDRPGRYARARVGRLHALLRRRTPRRAATPTSPCSCRSSAASWVEQAVARDRWFPGFVPHVQPAGEAGARLPRGRAHAAARDGSAGAGRGGRAARLRALLRCCAARRCRGGGRSSC